MLLYVTLAIYLEESSYLFRGGDLELLLDEP
jgi:hypothetical protein